MRRISNILDIKGNHKPEDFLKKFLDAIGIEHDFNTLGLTSTNPKIYCFTSKYGKDGQSSYRSFYLYR